MMRLILVLILMSAIKVNGELCKLCREDTNRTTTTRGDKKCLPDCIQKRVVELQRRPKEVMVSLSLDSSALNGNCSVVVVGPGDSLSNATVVSQL